MDPAEIDAIEVRLFLDAVFLRYGYDLRSYSPASMQRRVRAALARSGYPSLGELQHAMLGDAEVFGRVFEDLTVRVSEMFRDPPFQLAFRTRVAPLLQTYPQLRIWHAGCAGGEEVYSTAIQLEEEGLYERAQIYATDISMSALDEAKQGVYSADRLKQFTENYKKSGGTSLLSHYYTEAYDRLAVKESLRRNVLFFPHNLVSDYVFGEMNVIFCRNVLIYFNEELRAEVLRKFAASLCPGGFLCLGGSERLSDSMRGPFVDFAPNERIYRYEANQ